MIFSTAMGLKDWFGTRLVYEESGTLFLTFEALKAHIDRRGRVEITDGNRNDNPGSDGWAADLLIHPVNEFYLRLLDLVQSNEKESGGRPEFIQRVQYKIEKYPEIVESAATPSK